MSFPPDLGHIFNLSKIETSAGTGGDTGWFEAHINSVFAIITFYHFACFRVPLGSTPGACRYAGLASHTQIRINEDNAVLASFLHGSGGTGRHAPGVFAVKTGHENIGCPGKTTNELGTHLDDLARAGSAGKSFVCFALDFTGSASNAFFSILEKVVFTHSWSPIDFGWACLGNQHSRFDGCFILTGVISVFFNSSERNGTITCKTTR
jgi:hypothetical protein